MKRELVLYSEKVESENISNLFYSLTKRNVPFLGVFDFSYIFSSIPSPIYIIRNGSTLKFFVDDNEVMKKFSNLIFPFKMGRKKDIEIDIKSSALIPRVYIMQGENLLDFLIKEDIQKVSFFVRRILGKYIGILNALDSKGRKHKILVLDPEKFLEVDLEKHPSIYIELLEPVPKKITLNSKLPLFEDGEVKIGLNNYDAIQHSLIVGESGSGKTKALEIMVRALESETDVKIILIDPHNEFSQIGKNRKLIDYKKNYIEPLDMGENKSPLMTQLISQLISSTIGEDNKYSERILFFTTYILSSVDMLNLDNISKILTDDSFRTQIVSKSDVLEAKRFFDQEYQDIYIRHFNDAILPILNFIGEYELYLKKDMEKESLLDSIAKNKITAISFDPNYFGKRMIKFLAGTIINQMYILAITKRLDVPVILIVDEFPRVETGIVKDILAETRKYNLYVYLSMQYLNQLKKEIVDAIISNTKNIISFKTNRQDARLLSSVMEIKLEEYFKKNRNASELEESKRDMFVRLNQRECIVRFYDGRKYLIPMKVNTVDMKNFEYAGKIENGEATEEPFEKFDILD